MFKAFSAMSPPGLKTSEVIRDLREDGSSTAIILAALRNSRQRHHSDGVRSLPFTRGMPDVDSDVKYFGFAIAILISSLTAGLGPGLLATALSAFASAFLLLAPVFSISIASEEKAIRLLLFVGEGVLLSILGYRIRDASSDDARLPGLKRYAAAALFIFCATGLKLLAWHDVENEMPFALYYAATAAAAWTGGLGPGLLATLLASVCARYFFIEPQLSFSIGSPALALRELVFITEGMALSFLSARSARRFARRVIVQMRQQTDRLFRGEENARALKAISRDVLWEWELPSPTAQLGESDGPEAIGGSANFHLWFRRIHPKDRLESACQPYGGHGGRPSGVGLCLPPGQAWGGVCTGCRPRLYHSRSRVETGARRRAQRRHDVREWDPVEVRA